MVQLIKLFVERSVTVVFNVNQSMKNVRTEQELPGKSKLEHSTAVFQVIFLAKNTAVD